MIQLYQCLLLHHTSCCMGLPYAPNSAAQVLQMEGTLGLEALGLWGMEVSEEAGGLGKVVHYHLTAPFTVFPLP